VMSRAVAKDLPVTPIRPTRGPTAIRGVTMEPIWAVGLMTGTVLDGNIDVALIKTDGERIADFGTYTLAPYPQSMRALLEERLRKEAAASGDTGVLNIGGVGNITWWDGKNAIVAFDTGPANAPVNDFIKSKGLGEMDRDGKLAAAGTVDEARLERLLQHPYLTKPYPKSLDRFDFTAAMADGLGTEDGAATLTAFTVAAVGKALDLLPRRPKRLAVSGGGRRNPTMMAMLGRRAGVEVVQAETLGWKGDAVEAECFAFLAVRVLRGLPISFPSTTGVPQP